MSDKKQTQESYASDEEFVKLSLYRFIEEATNGDVNAMLILAENYEKGVLAEVEKDEKEDQANYWRTMYNQNDGDYKLATHYESLGEYQEAFPYFAKAAANGNDKAMVELGLLYRDSKVYQINYWNSVDLVDLYEKVLKEDSKAIFELCTMYINGFGVPEDEEKAYQLLMKSAELDYIPAILRLAHLHNDGIKINENGDFAKDLFIKAAELGSDEAKIFLLTMYHDDKNETEKERLLEEIFQTSDAPTMYSIGMLYYHGDIVKKQDYSLALKWLEKSVENGYTDNDIMFKIMNIYSNGIGNINPDKEKAEYWRNRLHNDEIDYSETNTFHLPEENCKKAMYWFKRAAAENNVDAIFNIGLLYDHGGSWGCDFEEGSMFIAKKWYTKAANLGHKEAEEHLKELILYMEDHDII